jgi:hypothetical protein
MGEALPLKDGLHGSADKGSFVPIHLNLIKTIMKKTITLTINLYWLLPLLLVSVLYFSCRSGGKKETAQQAYVNPKLGANSYCNPSRLPPGTAQSPGFISVETAKLLSQNYSRDMGKNMVWEKGTDRSEEQDALCIWFDLLKMKRFITYVESSACGAGCGDSLKLGIRFYYAKYPDKNTMEKTPDLLGVPLEYANHHTLFMVPTYRDYAKNKNVDFDPQSFKKGCIINQPFITGKGIVYLGFDSTNNTTDIQNHGSMRPPPPNTGIFPEGSGLQ